MFRGLKHSSWTSTKTISDSRFSGCKRYHGHGTNCSICCHDCETKTRRISERIAFTPFLLQPSGLDLLPEVARKSCGDRRSKKKAIHRKSSVFTSDKDSWSLKSQ